MGITTILTDYYGLEDCKLTPLEGYDSINFKVGCAQGTFVLKQYPYSEETFQLLLGEHMVLAQLEPLKDAVFPKPIETLDGKSIVIEDQEMYRLLSFVAGEFLGNIAHTKELLYSLGTFLGTMDSITAPLHSPAIKAREIQWDLRHFHTNYKYLRYIPEVNDRNLIDYFFLQFDMHVLPVASNLRRGIIHNDGNDWNVLTTNGRVTGIIDFGDMCATWLINEVAVALTYVMMHKSEPLKVGAYLLQGYHRVMPLQSQEIDLLYYLIAARLCTSVCNSAYAKRQRPDSTYITVSEKPAWELIRRWLTINPIKATNCFRKACGFTELSKKTLEHQTQRRQANFSGALSLTYTRPIEMFKSAFQYMYDTSGNTFLDAYNNIMLAGHCHPKVVRAGQHQMAQLNTNTRYLYESLLTYSERLLDRFPAALNKVFFVNSGSAASDLAIRLAMTHTEKKKIMVLEHGYHGHTRLGIDVSHYKYSHQGGPGRQQDIVQTELPKAFGSGYRDDGEAGDYFAQRASDQISENRNEIAAYIAEPIVGCGGQVPLAQGYLKQVYAEIRAQGGVCISDEVQVGFGRLGHHFWGFEMHHVVPDIVIIGKPMGNGHPIGAVVTTSEIARSFENGLEFFSSFGGNPVSCAIGQAVLDVIDEESLQERAKEVGDYLKQGFRRLQKHHHEIDEVRGSGLFLGVELVDAHGEPHKQLAYWIKNRLREKYILISTDGPNESVLKIKPPLSFSLQNADTLIRTMDEVLMEFKKK